MASALAPSGSLLISALRLRFVSTESPDRWAISTQLAVTFGAEVQARTGSSVTNALKLCIPKTR